LQFSFFFFIKIKGILHNLLFAIIGGRGGRVQNYQAFNKRKNSPKIMSKCRNLCTVLNRGGEKKIVGMILETRPSCACDGNVIGNVHTHATIYNREMDMSGADRRNVQVFEHDQRKDSDMIKTLSDLRENAERKAQGLQDELRNQVTILCIAVCVAVSVFVQRILWGKSSCPQYCPSHGK